MDLDRYKVLFWDYDGVIMDSNPVRTLGFREVLASYPAGQVDELITYHEKNGGLPRYEKFRYFFEDIRHEKADENLIAGLSARFTAIMLAKLTDPALLIQDTVKFIKGAGQKFIMHIVSGSDQKELRQICDALDLTQYFVSIVGSPALKPALTGLVLQQYGYHKAEVAFIGDSVNDLDAARQNGLDFYGYNDPKLRRLSTGYIESFSRSAADPLININKNPH